MLGIGTFPSLSLSELMPRALICAGAGSPNLPVPKPGPQQSAAPRAALSGALSQLLAQTCLFWQN